MLHVVMLLLATLWPPLQMEIRLTPSALQSANKDKEPHGRLRRPWHDRSSLLAANGY
jgi:hypothetical protein